MTLAELRALVAKLEAEQRAIAEEAKPLTEIRDITPEDDDKLTEILGRHAATTTELDAKRAELATAEERARQIEAVRKQTTEVVPGSPDFQHQRAVETDIDISRSSRSEIRDSALKILEERGTALSPGQQTHVDKLLRSTSGDLSGTAIARRAIVTENESYRSAFLKLMTRNHPILSPEEVRAVNRYYDETRAMNEGTGADGGFGIPILIDPTIILSSGALESPILQMCTIKTITTDAWKGVVAPGATWQYSAEAAAVSDGSPTLTQPNIPVYKADGFIPYSIEVEQDYPGFAEEMAKLLDQGYLDLIAPALATGSGSSQPTGVFTHMVSTTTNPAHILVTTAGTLGAVDLRATWNALPERFRPKASWFMNVDVQSAIEALGNNLALADFTANLASAGPSMLEGKPVVLSDYAPTFTNTTGVESVTVVGDFSAYYFIQRAGMTVELVNHLFDQSTARPTGQRGWFAYARHGGDVVNANAFRILRSGSGG